MPQQINIAIAEDHQLFRQGMIGLLKNDERMNILFDVGDGQQLLDKLTFCTPDIVLLDIRMPVMGGKEALDIIHKKYPAIKVIIISSHFTNAYTSEFISAGASGFLPKNADFETLQKAILTVYEQGYYFDDAVSRSVFFGLIRSNTFQPNDDNALTDREIEILKLLCEDYTTPEIAGALFISTRTVEWHKKNIFDKTQSKTLAGLVIYAIKHNVISSPDEGFNSAELG